MIQAIYYKEWHKSRWAILIILLLFIGILTYSFITIAQNLRVNSADNVWDMIIQKGIYYFGQVKYIPLLAGTLIAITQFVPEMINKRLKLTLHLPLSENKIMLAMLSYGVIHLCVIFLLSYSAIFIGTKYFFPSEIAHWNTIVTFPWYLGGIVAYLVTTWICIEPVWKQRVFNSLIAVCILALFYFDAAPKAYSPSLIYLVIITLLSSSFSFLSLIRFKDGELF